MNDPRMSVGGVNETLVHAIDHADGVEHAIVILDRADNFLIMTSTDCSVSQAVYLLTLALRRLTDPPTESVSPEETSPIKQQDPAKFD